MPSNMVEENALRGSTPTVASAGKVRPGVGPMLAVNQSIIIFGGGSDTPLSLPITIEIYASFELPTFNTVRSIDLALGLNRPVGNTVIGTYTPDLLVISLPSQVGKPAKLDFGNINELFGPGSPWPEPGWPPEIPPGLHHVALEIASDYSMNIYLDGTLVRRQAAYPEGKSPDPYSFVNYLPSSSPKLMMSDLFQVSEYRVSSTLRYARPGMLIGDKVFVPEQEFLDCDPNTVALYHFDATVPFYFGRDSSVRADSEYDYRLIGTLPVYTPDVGPIAGRGAADMSGSRCYLRTPLFFQYPFTIETRFRLKPGRIALGAPFGAVNLVGSAVEWYCAVDTNGFVGVGAASATSLARVFPADPLLPDTWHHIAMVVENQNMFRILLDGVCIGRVEDSPAGPAIPTDIRVYAGRQDAGPGVAPLDAYMMNFAAFRADMYPETFRIGQKHPYPIRWRANNTSAYAAAVYPMDSTLYDTKTCTSVNRDTDPLSSTQAGASTPVELDPNQVQQVVDALLSHPQMMTAQTAAGRQR